MTPRPPLPNPHDVSYKRAIARALEMEREMERLEAEADARVHRAAVILYGVIAFCITWLLLTAAPLAFNRSVNIFFTLAVNALLWSLIARRARSTRRPQ